jgi:NADPH-dependent curcumin reductase CurA
MPLCGLISGYNDGTAGIGDFSPILMRRLSVRGFIVIDMDEPVVEQLWAWRTTVRSGLSSQSKDC